jgi:uncharacterized protein (DUF58 family)
MMSQASQPSGFPACQLPSLPASQPPRRGYWLPRTIRPTREGWWFIAATFVVGLAATNTGNNLLYLILAMMLSFVAISGILSEQTMRHLTLQRQVPTRLFAGVRAAFGLRLVNRKRRLPSYALHVIEPDPAGGRSASHYVLKLAPQARDTWQYALTFPRRGRHQLPGLRLFTRFPFGLFAKVSRPLLADAVLIYPAIRPLQPAEIPAALEPGWRDRDRRGHGASLHNLRQYRPGDDSRLLHWKTSARAGELMVKELEDEDRPRLRLVVGDPEQPTSPTVLDANLSYAASLAARAIRSGSLVQLVTADEATGFGEGEAHLDHILERLALYEAPATPRPLAIPADPARTVHIALDARGTVPVARA